MFPRKKKVKYCIWKKKKKQEKRGTFARVKTIYKYCKWDHAIRTLQIQEKQKKEKKKEKKNNNIKNTRI